MDRRYFCECWRLVTFTTFPREAYTSTILLAREGFIYLGLDGSGEAMVVCVFCLSWAVIPIYDNLERAHIVNLHVSLNASCPLVRGDECGSVLPGQSDGSFWRTDHEPSNLPPNVESSLSLRGDRPRHETDGNATWELVTSQTLSSPPISVSGQQNTLSSAFNTATDNVSNSKESFTGMANQSMVGTSEMSRNPSWRGCPSKSSVGHGQHDGRGGSACDIRAMGVITRHSSQYPSYSNERKRLASYQGWNSRSYLKPEDLAKAGYFFEGFDDLVLCFHCGCGFRDWVGSIDPWVAHIRNYPNCCFLQASLGDTFVDVALSLLNEGNNRNVLLRYEDIVAEMKARHREHEIPEGVHFQESLGQTIRRASKDEDVATAADEKSQLFAENQGLLERFTCKVCCAERASLLILPCGHLFMCIECAFSVDTCRDCGQTINGLVKVHLS